MSNFNVQVTYGEHRKLFSCSYRREFLKQVSDFFGISKAAVQLFEITKNSRNLITVNDIKDKMEVEIRKKGQDVSQPISNGDGLTNVTMVPNLELLNEKLTRNRVLTGVERKFLLQLIEDFSSITNKNRKRKRGPEDEEDTPKPIMVNKKVQVEVIKHSAYTQTDNLINHNPDKPSTSTNKELISECKRLARMEKKDKVKVCQLMNETFDTRRQFILLQNPILTLVKEKYPLLFSTEEVRNELNRIFCDKRDEEFLQSIQNCTHAILDLVEEDNPLAKKIEAAVKNAQTTSQKSYAKQVGALLMISNIMRESRTYLYTEDEPCVKNNYPRIEAPCEVSKLFEDLYTYRIIVEGTLLCEPSTFPEAILCLIACYFIFNINYPESAFNTMVLFERVFLDASDTDDNEIDEHTSQIIKLIKLKSNAQR